MRSAGTRSGVNWTRPKLQPRTVPRAVTVGGQALAEGAAVVDVMAVDRCDDPARLDARLRSRPAGDDADDVDARRRVVAGRDPEVGPVAVRDRARGDDLLGGVCDLVA